MTLRTATLVAFIASKDSARALAFYRDLLGLRLVADDASGRPLRMQKVGEFQVAPHTALGWQVSSIETEVGEGGLVQGSGRQSAVADRALK